MSAQTQSGILTIDLGALADNYHLFQSMVSSQCEIAGVIKANAYGLGIIEIFNKLRSLGCPQFFVATLDEALLLKNHDAGANIAVFGGLFKGAENEYLEHNITPVLNSLDDIARWKNIAKEQSISLPAFLHFDTGMNRLGLSADETETLINNSNLLDGIDVQMIMSHFACANEDERSLTQQQADKFDAITAHFPKAKKSLSNSSGLFADKAYHYNLARPGYALYGGNPTPHLKNPVKSVINLKAKILQVREVKAGESIGYDASHTFRKDTRTATIALGYADGFLRSHSTHGDKPAKLYYNNTACEVVGRVSMDLVTIDIGNMGGPNQGDWLEVLGPNQGVDDLACAAGTIGYEILTSLGTRYKRHYINT